MAAQSTKPPEPPRQGQPTQPSPPREDTPTQPWRTEGLPKGAPTAPRRRWTTAAIALVGYLILFGVLTLQDRLSGPQAIPYTDFKTQVASKNIAELFARGDSIEGQLKKAVPLPADQNRTYQQFTTERPTFASDDLLAELTQGGATVR